MMRFVRLRVGNVGFSLLAITLPILCCFGRGLQSAYAQESSSWSVAVSVSTHESSNVAPSITVDYSGRVYAAWILNPEEPTDNASSIFLAVGEGGTFDPARDVIAFSRRRGLSNVRIEASDEGYLYLLWQNDGAYISSAAIVDALDPRSWAEPKLVIQAAQTEMGFADLAVDSEGGLHICYPDQQVVYYLKSTNGGLTWSDPVVAGETARHDQLIHGTRIATSADGKIHVVWNQLQLPDGWPPQGVFHTQSGDGGKTWEQRQVAGEQHNYISVATWGSSDVHLVGNTTPGIGVRYHTMSTDGGETWTPLDPFAKLSGSTQLFVALDWDTLGTLHLATIASGDADGVHYSQSVWYSYWQGAWSDPELVYSAQERGPHRIDMAVSEGNRINIIWQEDSGQIQYSTKTTSSPAVPITPLRAPAPTVESRPYETANVEPTDTPISKTVPHETAALTVPLTSLPRSAGPFAILIGVIFAGLLVSAIVLFERTRFRG